jgi:hypothetical protein
MKKPSNWKDKRPKKKYDVFFVREGHGCYASTRKYIGSTWASSPEQASNNVRYRVAGKALAFNIVGDIAEEGDYLTYYEAELSKGGMPNAE